MDTPTPAPSKDKHLTSKCPQHNLKVTIIAKQPDGTQLFLCKLCKPKGNEKTYYIADLLDDEFGGAINDKIESQTREAETIEQKNQTYFRFLDNTFADLRKDFDAILNEAQEKMKKKFLGYINDKKTQSTNWVDVKQEYEEKLQGYLDTAPLTSSPELNKFLDVYDKTMQCLQSNIESENSEDYEINRDEIQKFRKSMKAQSDVLTDKLIRFNFSHLSIKIDAIKEEQVVNTGHKGVFKALVVLDDLNMFATGSTDGEIGLWNSDDLSQVSKFKAHKSFVSSLLYIPSKKVLISASLDRTIKVFEVADRKINQDGAVTLTAHKSFIYGLCYLDDLNKFVSIGHEPEIKIWDVNTLKLDSTISTNGWSSDSYEIAYIKDEGCIAVVGKDIIRIYNLSTKNLVSEIKTGGLSMQSVQYLRKQKALVAAVDKGKIRVWTVAGGTFSPERDITFEDIGDTPYTILALEDQNVLAVTTRSKFVCFINFSNGNLVKKGTPLKDGIAIALLKHQGKIIVADNSSDKVTVFSL